MVKIDKETKENNLPKENNKKEPSWQPKTDCQRQRWASSKLNAPTAIDIAFY